MKSQTLRKSGLLQLHRGGTGFDSLGGLKALKAFCKRSLLQPGRNNPLKRPRGTLLLGVPGVGKSAFAKSLSAETGRPTLLLDVGALFGSLVGQSEQNMRQALKIAEAMAPCILYLDETEKGLSGVASRTADLRRCWRCRYEIQGNGETKGATAATGQSCLVVAHLLGRKGRGISQVASGGRPLGGIGLRW